MHLFQPDCFGERITLERQLRRVDSAGERAQEYMEILADGISLPATIERFTLKVLTKKSNERTGSERAVVPLLTALLLSATPFSWVEVFSDSS